MGWTGLYWEELGYTGMDWVCTGLDCVIVGWTGLYWEGLGAVLL